MSATKSKKYKLFSAAADGGKRPCAFFGTAEGCRKGDSCPFVHSNSVVVPDSPSPVNTSNSVVSSESEGEVETPFVVKEGETPKESTPKKKKNKRKRETDQVFAKPKGHESTTKYANMALELGVHQDNIMSIPPKEEDTLKSTPVAAAASSNPKQKKAKKIKEEAKAANSFRNLNLPITNFTLSRDDGKKKEKTPSKVKEEEAPAPTPPAPVRTPNPQKKYPLPVSTEVGRNWKDVVAQSQANSKFADIFDFDKYKEQDIPGDVWVKSKPFGEWCASNPAAIAIDCEMCETTDPLTEKKDPSALCRISIVNAEDPDDVLLNTLVKPTWPVTDYRTFVNGITKEHLEPVQFTLRHAQAFMVALCSEETVILGHAVHNDLAAMRMEHYCVGDSALLFKAKDSPTATVGLKDLAKTLFNKEMPAVHDSVNDAVTALKCLDLYREKKGDVEEIVRTPKLHRDFNNNRTHHKLFVHRIPKYCKSNHLAKMFLEHTSIAPEEVDEIDFPGTKGKTHVSFKTPRHAWLAFDTLTSEAIKEGSGRLQKKVWLRDGDYVQVRKMAFEKGHQFPDGKEVK